MMQRWSDLKSNTFKEPTMQSIIKEWFKNNLQLYREIGVFNQAQRMENLGFNIVD